MNALAHTRPDFIFLPEVPPTGGLAEDLRPHDAHRASPEFFSRAATEPPRVDLSRYRLTVAGLVSRTSQFSLDDLRLGFPEHEVVVQVRDEKSAQSQEVRWQGCWLEDVLGFVGVSHVGAYLEFIGASSSRPEDRGEPFLGLISVDRLQSHPLLGWTINGKPLTAAQGAPLTALIPENDGYRCIRWLHRINLLVHQPAWAMVG